MKRPLHPDLLPWSSEAEQAVIGSVLLDQERQQIAEQLGLKADHFFDARHRRIWTAISSLVASRLPIDTVTVFERLQERTQEQPGVDIGYLSALAEAVPSASGLGRYVAIVQDKAMRRAILAAADRAQEIAVEAGGTASDKVDRAASLFSSLATQNRRNSPRPLSELIVTRLDHWQALAGGEVTGGIPTRLETLDKALGGGLKPGKLIVVAARPSVGKTSLAGQIAISCAQGGHGVLVLSQEMTAGELVDRTAANLGRVSLSAITSGQFSDEDFSRLAEAADKAARLPLYIDDEPGLTLAAINAKARSLHRQEGLSLLVVDYLQLCSGGGSNVNRNLQIEEISRGLKTLAKELGVTVIALSQLSRKSVERGEPDLSDLRDSGAIEQDADTVVLLHPVSDLGGGAFLLVAILAKNRQGRRGRIALEFLGATQRWEESSADVTSSRTTGRTNQS